MKRTIKHVITVLKSLNYVQTPDDPTIAEQKAAVQAAIDILKGEKKRIEGCPVCKDMEPLYHKNEGLPRMQSRVHVVDDQIEADLWQSGLNTGFVIKISYCPICGRYLKEIPTITIATGDIHLGAGLLSEE